MLDVLGIKNADKLVPLEDDQKPKDPVTENMNALKGKPLKAFIYQDHEAHIAVHQAAMQDPTVQQLIGQNPQAQAIMGAMQAHIAEHVGYAYRMKIEAALGVQLPAPDQEMPEDMEKEMSKMMAMAAPQVLAQSKAMMAQQQAQQNSQDPVLQLQMQELQLKQQDMQIKAQKVAADTDIQQKRLAADAAAKADELALKREELSVKMELEGKKFIAQNEIEGVKLAGDIVKTRQAKQKPTKD
jgi:hypothetical protein